MFSTYLDLNRYFYLYCSHKICLFPDIIQSKLEIKQNEYVKIKMYNSTHVGDLCFMDGITFIIFVLILKKKIIAQRVIYEYWYKCTEISDSLRTS